MKIQGNLATYEFSDLLQWLAQGNKTGVLTVSNGGVEYQLGFDHGRIDMSSSSDSKQRLDNYLFGKGLIDEATLARADRLREATKMMSGQVLVTLGAVSEPQLAGALRERTEEILCELLTWDEGSFEFEGGDRPASSMVPISLEVTKLLLESMHRLDQQRGGQPVPQPEPASISVESEALEVDRGAPPRHESPEATQAIEGLALAEVLDPERPERHGDGDSHDIATENLLPNYAAMAEQPGAVQRFAPFAVVAVLTLTGAAFYLANRDASAQAADTGPTGQPILFTPTAGPLPSGGVSQAAPAISPPVVAPAPAAVGGESEEALRRRYEQELAELRRELAEARQQTEPTARAPRPLVAPAGETDLPADSIMRASVTRLDAESPPAAVPATAPAAIAPTTAARAETPSPPPPPAANPLVAEPSASVASAEVKPLRMVNPKLVSRPTPRYPAAAQRHRRGATVTVRVLVGPDGRVKEAEIVGPKAGMGFDRAAEHAALASVWKSGTRNGEPDEMWAELRFEFKP